ncbi:hypothetical protein [Hahella ganghwensis]|uniref:hypothetical protein n=1 Tax=Hahella ganghwensis TaxID=286420 RepID=UPI00037F9E38|nr:hypothetical protein [Hahella ganghwensis]
MCPEHRKLHVSSGLIRSQRQSGLGLPAALFLIVVLGLLVVAITELERTTAEGVSINVQSARAFYAAQSGAEAALVTLFPIDEADPSNAAAPTDCPAYGTISFNAGNTGLIGCSADISCFKDEVSSVAYFTLRSTGSCGSGAEAATRTIEVRAH